MLDLSAPEENKTFPITLSDGTVVEAREPSADLIRRMVRLGEMVKKTKDKEKAGLKVIDETYEAMKQLGFSEDHLKRLTIPQCDRILKYVMEEAKKKYQSKSSI